MLMKQAQSLGFLSRMMDSLQSSSVEVSSAASYSKSCDDGVVQAFTSLSLSPTDNNTSLALPSRRVLHRSMVGVRPAESSSSSPMKEDDSNENVTEALHIGPPSSVDRIASMVTSCSEMRCEAALPAVSGFTVASVCPIAPASCDSRISGIQTKRKRRLVFPVAFPVEKMGTIIMGGREVVDVPVDAPPRRSKLIAKRRKRRVKLGMMETIVEGRPQNPDFITMLVP